MVERGMIQIDRVILSSVLNKLVGMPNPDDPGDPHNPFGPWGPHGPVLGPLPDPWRVAAPLVLLPPVAWQLAREMINATAILQQSVSALPAEAQGVARESVQVQLRAFLDDWHCGNEPRWPFPWPKPHNLNVTLEPTDLVMAGTMLQQTAKSLNAGDLSAEFAQAGQLLVERGLNGQ